jgi:ribosomal protein S18 acetylase RimI-like enzyme
VPADVDTVLGLYDAYDLQEFGEVDVYADDVAAILANPRAQMVLVDEPVPPGFAFAFATGEVETAVNPAVPGWEALQGELLAWAVEAARGMGVVRVEHWCGVRADGAAARLAAAGFTHARTAWKMRRDLVGELLEPRWPAGVTVREFDRERDAEAVWDLVQRGFAGTFGSHPRPFDEWCLFALGDGKDAVCAVEDGGLVGVATTGIRNGDGEVGQLTVDPAHRGRGIALGLLHEVFRRDAAAGRPATTLGVDGANANARRLYDKAGMRAVDEYRRWERDT